MMKRKHFIKLREVVLGGRRNQDKQFLLNNQCPTMSDLEDTEVKNM